MTAQRAKEVQGWKGAGGDGALNHQLACWRNYGQHATGEPGASQAKIAELETTVGRLTAHGAELGTNLHELGTEAAAGKKALADATAQREKGIQGFHGGGAIEASLASLIAHGAELGNNFHELETEMAADDKALADATAQREKFAELEVTIGRLIAQGAELGTNFHELETEVAADTKVEAEAIDLFFEARLVEAQGAFLVRKAVLAWRVLAAVERLTKK